MTVLWNQIMTSLTCCGVEGYQDFSSPPSICCSAGQPQNSTLQDCPATPTSQMETGCFNLLISGSVPAIASSLAVVAVFQIAGVILACCLARKVEDKREWYEMRSM